MIRSFNYIPARAAGQILFDGFPYQSAIEWPNFIHGQCQNIQANGQPDQFGWRYKTIDGTPYLLADDPFVVKLKNAMVQRVNFGQDRWHVAVSPGVCIEETYYSGEWFNRFCGQTMRIPTNAGSFDVHVMEDIAPESVSSVPSVLLAHQWDTNYAHCLMETVGKLFLAEHWDDHLPQLIWNPTTPYQREIADLLSIKYVPQTQKAVQYDELYVISQFAHNGICAEQFKQIRALFQQRLCDKIPYFSNPPVTSGNKRILISRNDATSRRIANESNIMTALAPMGFERVTLSNLSVLDQAKLFHSASIIVAPHGAGLMNMLFASPSTALIEIAPESYQHPLFWYVAKWLGHWYGRIITPDHGSEKDMIIDIAAVKNAIDAAISSKSVRSSLVA